MKKSAAFMAQKMKMPYGKKRPTAKLTSPNMPTVAGVFDETSAKKNDAECREGCRKKTSQQHEKHKVASRHSHLSKA